MGQLFHVTKSPHARYGTLQAALEVAQDGDVIEVSGTYDEAIAVTKKIVIRGQSACFTNKVRISKEAQLENIQFRHTVEVTHDHVGFINCGFQPESGPALITRGETLLLQCHIQKGTTGVDAYATTTLQGCTIQHTHTGISAKDVSITMEHCTVLDSAAFGVSIVGGELLMHDVKVLRCAQSNIQLNRTQASITQSTSKNSINGAGLWAMNGSTVSLIKSELSNNAKPNVSISHSQLFIEQCQLLNSNQCGIWMEKQSKAHVVDCTISHNVYANIELSESMIKLANCAIEHSTADGFYATKRSIAHITDCQFHHNAGCNIVYIHSEGSIMNCTIHDAMKNGILLDNHARISLKQSKLFRNAYAAVTLSDSEIDVDNCDFFDGAQSGIWCKEKGSATVRNSHFHEQQGAHLIIEHHSTLTLTRCKLQKAQQNGVWARHNSRVVVNDCKIADCFYPGIGGSQSTIEVTKTTIENNREHGIWLKEGSVATIRDCDIQGNGYCNISSDDSDLTLIDSRLSDAKEYGMILKEHSNSVVERTSIRTSGYDNMYVASMAVLEMHDSSCEYAERDGLYVHSNGSAVVENSHFAHNKQYGFYEKADAANVEIHDAIFAHNGQGDHLKEGAIIEGTPQRLKRPTPEELTALTELDQLVGLDAVKQSVHNFVQLCHFQHEAAALGFDEPTELFAEHIVLTGNPGTGKTTVAHILAKLYQQLSLLEKGHVVQVNREQLVASFVGQTAPKTQQKIDEAMGGVLFIDEAYALTNRHTANDFGPEAIEVLLEAMEIHRGQFIVIVAGYPEEMTRFLKSNPGFESRFSQFYQFDDYTPEEMLTIATQQFTAHKRQLTIAANAQLMKEFIKLWRKKDRFFANARTVRQYVHRILSAQKLRCMTIDRAKWSTELLSTIAIEDVETIIERPKQPSFDVPIQEDMLDEALAELHALVGLAAIKQQVDQLIMLTRHYRAESKDVRALTTNFLLMGRAGTGKTVVGRILAKIYEALGIVTRGELIEITCDMLVGPHIGDVERYTHYYLERAHHGVLFIDDAHELLQYGSRVIDLLLKYIDTHRGDIVVMLAGNPQQMDALLQSHAGLARRFDETLFFDDYSPEQLLNIAQHLAQADGYTIDKTAIQQLSLYVMHLYEYRDETFANGHLVYNLVQKAIRQAEHRDIEAKTTNAIITAEDFHINKGYSE